jgi:hypothetical protein
VISVRAPRGGGTARRTRLRSRQRQVAIERQFAEIARQKQCFESLVGISPVAVIEMDAGSRSPVGTRPPKSCSATRLRAVGRPIDYLVFDEAHREEPQTTEEAVAVGRAHRITRRPQGRHWSTSS